MTLDDETQRAAALRDPRSFVERDIDGRLIVDEVQFAPPLYGALKAAVDRDRRSGRFVLTVSTRLLSADGFADAFVGRLQVVELWPFSQGEINGSADGLMDWAFLNRPSVIASTRTARRRDAWFDSGLACSLVGIEVKASSTITTRDTKGLRFLEQRLGDRFHAGYVISTLPEPTPLGAKITAVPCNWLWEAGTANTAT